MPAPVAPGDGLPLSTRAGSRGRAPGPRDSATKSARSGRLRSGDRDCRRGQRVYLMNEERSQIREATEADTQTVAAFNRAMAKETESLTLDAARSEEGARVGLSDAHRAKYYVSEVDGQVVGQMMVTVEWSDWRNAFWWWIQSVYVDPAYRRHGVFRRLYAHVRELARQCPDCCGLRLYVHRSNTRAMQTYQALGMELTDYLVCEENWSGK